MQSHDFMAWVTDPARTSDELFTVELLLEGVRHRQDWPFRQEHDFYAEVAIRRERKLNPRYRSSLNLDELRALAERRDTVTHFRSWGDRDRAVRDLRALSFFPALVDLSIGGSDVADLSPLRSLMKLQRLSIGEYGEFAGAHPISFAECGDMPELSYLHLALRSPWPDLRALADWPALREIVFNGNILALEEIEQLPAARAVAAKEWVHASVPVRNLRSLPRMPQVKRLCITAASLNGIDRYPTAVNVDLAGPFRDLTPLAAMENTTALILTGEHFKDLSPLARMPRLRELHLVRERAIDLAPLTDAPQLRRVTMDRCSIMRTELAALNAGLLPEAIDFQSDTPRPLPPLKFFRVTKENNAGTEFFQQRDKAFYRTREDFFDDDLAMKEAERRVYATALQTRLDALLGRGWGLVGNTPHFIHLKRYPDTQRVRDVVQILRAESARLQFPWKLAIIVEPHGDMSDDLEQMKAREEKEAEPEDKPWLDEYYDPDFVLRENAEQREQRAERFELIQSEHRAQLHEGDEHFDPDALRAAQQAADTAEVDDEENESAEENAPLTPADDDDDENNGGVAIAPPPPAPPETKSIGEELMFCLDVHEDCIVAQGDKWAERASAALGEEALEWTPNESSVC